MPLSRDNLERQLAQAKQLRDACTARLKQSGVEESALKKQPAWRSANAACRQLTRRLNTVSGKEKLAAEVATRKDSGDDDE
jgi:hypothetical protein